MAAPCRKAGRNTADQAKTVGIAVEQHESGGMLLHQTEGAVEPRFVAKASDPGDVAEAASGQEEQDVANKRAAERGRVSLPGMENAWWAKNPARIAALSPSAMQPRKTAISP